MSEDTALRELERDPSSRKRFLKAVGGAGAAGALGLLLAACGDDEEEPAGGGRPRDGQPSQEDEAAGSDLEIVNFALTLEYLEAKFYDEVVRSGVLTDQEVVDLARQFGETEREHVEALRAVAMQLGTPAEEPQTDFQAAIEGGPELVLQTAADVENLGAAAYLGQAPRLQSKAILASALAIHSVEARHAAALNELVGRDFVTGETLKGSIPDGAFARPLSMDEVLERIQPYLA